MSQIEFVDIESKSVHGIALIEPNGAVWITFSRPWWDLASQLWWWLSFGKNKWVQVRKKDGTKVRVQAQRLAVKNIRVG